MCLSYCVSLSEELLHKDVMMYVALLACIVIHRQGHDKRKEEVLLSFLQKGRYPLLHRLSYSSMLLDVLFLGIHCQCCWQKSSGDAGFMTGEDSISDISTKTP